MAPGKKSRKSPQNPFASLKGFCVSNDKPKKPVPPVSKALPEPALEEEPRDDGTLFAEEMERLGLSPGGPEASHEEAPEEETGEGTEKIRTLAPPTDQELFCAALGTMDAVFEDEFSPEEEVRAEPRRMRLVRRGQLLPEARLDLHGLHRDQAREKVRFFLENSVYQGFRTVLIITGRGLGSGSEPVLRTEIERYLTHQAGAWVVEWGRAPRQHGGEGALVVFLKG
ncbi:Smr domain-containing DNA-nicking endonuclease [Desulfuromonas soudanensis]|uniref:Smr domain-containing DNA-nicking endonuclease n=1 Tax=Desulfuromonas soudanensis TaxID=1603606 RepID=A0A0M3QFX8_9BACT|nr:Smr/MutS family protein [Desulfuromonas soudanensis]ALC16999.1 Smr domain-containing DNA-nicking endonuclease [Desulfuromonas soudanensis]